VTNTKARARERANARRIVEQQKARERRRAITLWTVAGVVLALIAAGIIGYGMMASQEKTAAGKLTTPSVAVDGGTAFTSGIGPVTVDLYEDFMCPVCRAFESADSAALKQLVTENKVTVRYHPVAILNASSNGTNYSTRAAGAAAAGAQAGKFLPYHDVLYANQPAEGSDGLSNAQLIELGKSVGLTSQDFADAVNHGMYNAWADKATETFSQRGYTFTPSIVVGGKLYQNNQRAYPTPAELTSLVAAAA
jgi:protein-disulfide isomerase